MSESLPRTYNVRNDKGKKRKPLPQETKDKISKYWREKPKKILSQDEVEEKKKRKAEVNKRYRDKVKEEKRTKVMAEILLKGDVTNGVFKSQVTTATAQN